VGITRRPSAQGSADRGPTGGLADLLDRWGWLVLLALAPLFLFPSPSRLPGLLAVPLLVWVQRSGKRAVRNRNPLDMPLLVIAVMVLVSTAITFDLSWSLGKIAGMVFAVGLFYAVAAWAGRSRQAFGGALGVHLGLGAAVAILGLLVTDWSAKVPALAPILSRLPRLASLPGAESTLVNPNELAGTLQWVLPVALPPLIFYLARAVRLRYPAGVALGAVCALGMLAGVALLALTQSRGGLLGFLAALFAMGLLAGRRLRRIALAVGVALALLGATVAVRAGSDQVTQAMLGSGSAAPGEATITGETRFEIWSRALYAIQDFPLTGVGLNNFRRLVPVMYPLFLIGPDQDIAHAHNTWLQVALDLGLPGLIAFVAIWLITLSLLINVIRNTRDRWLRAISIGIFGCLTAYSVYGMTDTIALGARPGFLFWTLLALATASWKLARRDREGAATAPPGNSKPASAGEGYETSGGGG
jgi:putative inorganic carbon (HCO3(-)) transporter